MAALNRGACEAMVSVGVSACTDVTGFGLLGHLHEMVEASGCAATLDLSEVPLFDRVFHLAGQGVVPGRTAEVTAWAGAFALWSAGSDEDVWMRVLCDPQTSGGLLIAVPAHDADRLAEELGAGGALAARIGRCTADQPGRITIR